LGLAGEKFAEPDCVAIPPGEFLMGSEAGRDEERPVHRVAVDAFEMAVRTVRNCDYAVYIAAAGAPEPPFFRDPAFRDPEQPVVGVSWFEAEAYCRWLSGASGRFYRLPTEAEWEKAARGGAVESLYPWGNEPPEERPEYRRRWSGKVAGPLPAGGGAPNAYGLYDMCENVHEWCADWYAKDFYSRAPLRNPSGPAEGTRRASRGGAWRHQVKASRCTARSSIPPEYRYSDYGFRLVRAGEADGRG
jgi:formylglycine-generating enzyme required for sulfatase activity